MKQIRKILLINPPWYRLFGEESPSSPLGLCYIGAVLEQNGYDVSIYNGDFTKSGVGLPSATKKTRMYDTYLRVLRDHQHPIWGEVRSIVTQQKPDVVGISLRTSAYGSALNVSHIIKEIDSSIPIVWGGVHPTALPEESLKNSQVDIVVRGEGEYTMLDLVKNNIEKLESIPGISYKKDGQITHNPDRALIHHLDDLPFPARHLIIDWKSCPPEALGNIFATRGCPYSCVFCASNKVWSRTVRYRSASNVISELQQLQQKFGVQQFSFEDDSFTINKKLVNEFCSTLIKERMKIRWRCETRVDLITKDLLEQMKKAGCEEIFLGLESGSPETLRWIKKGVTVEQMRSAVEILRQVGIRFSAFFMIGFPWETTKEINETLNLMKDLDPFAANLSIATPYPGTELHHICTEEGVVPANMDWSTFFHQSPDMFFSNKFSRQEVRELITKAQAIVGKHNRNKKRQLILSNPGYVINRVIKGKYYYPNRLWNLIRYTLGLS
ncbi:MAG: B12-binding radical SAM protein [Dehalococcoidia bacterium]|nr:B12-binding radical SAM protein [Dehalococcoidia bacterium]